MSLMIRRLPLFATIAILAAIVLLSGCDALYLTDPGDESCDIRDHADVCVHLDVPAAVGETDTLVARLTYTNLRPVPVTVTSGMGCNAFVGVYRDTVRIPFPATDYACTAAVTSWTLEGHETRTDTWSLAIGEDATPLEPGSYRFEADLNTHGQTLIRQFTVE